MKKVLLTTTALTLTAGVAAADGIEWSGTAGAAMVASGAANAVVVTGADLNFALSATADNDMTFSTSIDMGAGSLVDYDDDFALDAQDMGTDANPAVTIGYAGYTIVMDNEGVDDLYDDADANHKDISVAGSAGGADFAVAIDTDDNKTSASLGMSLGDVAVSFATSNEAGAAGGNSLGVTYAMGDVTLTGSTDDNGTAKSTNKVGVTYAMDAISLSYTLANTEEAGWDDYDVSISYSAGAMSATYATDEEGVNSLVATYDLGGGATFFASAKNDGDGNNVQQAAGVTFTF
jgi:hypothetical protein